MSLKTSFFILIAIFILIFGVNLQYDIFSKVRHIGNSPSEAIYYFFQMLKKDGLLNTFTAVRGKLGNDPRLGLGYSLADPTTYPPVESEVERALLPEYKTIPAADVANLPPSSGGVGNFDVWERSNGGNDSAKYSTLDQINRLNVNDLQVAWTYSSGPYKLDENMKNGSPVETNPVIANGRMFLASINSEVLCLDATTGKEIWRLKLPPPVARRGLVWEPNADFAKSRLFVPSGKGVYAINAATGEIQQEFGNKGQAGDQLSLIAPVIAGDKLIVALIKPAMEAYDLKTGKLLWATGLLERPPGDKVLLTGGSPWGGMSYDPNRGMVFVSTGNPRPELWGTTRPGANRHSNSVVALNVQNGEIKWSFQEVAHDLWDLDVPSPPVLTTIHKGGRRVDVVATVTKMGNTLLLDRDLGQPIFDYRLKRAPTSKIPGEKTWPYQPSVELPEPFMKQTFQEVDVTDISEAATRSVNYKIKGGKYGFYEPPTLGGKVVIYGVAGGAEWPGAAIDHNTGVIFIPSNQTPWIIRASFRDLKATSRQVEDMPGNTLYQTKCASCHGKYRDGYQEPELKGGFYYPALTGVSFIRARELLAAKAFFESNHDDFGGNTPSPQELKVVAEYLSALDLIADKDKSLAARTFWAPLLDDKGNPGSKPPWGLLTAIDLNNGKKIWQVPFGEYQNLFRGGKPVQGQSNVGGALVTAGGIVFATGTLDSKVRGFDSSNGKQLWAAKLPAPGFAPPSTYSVNGIQYVAIVTSERPLDTNAVRFDRVVSYQLSTEKRK